MSDRLTALFAAVPSVPEERVSDASSPANTPECDSRAAINQTRAAEAAFGVKRTGREIMAMTTLGLARDVLRQRGAAL